MTALTAFAVGRPVPAAGQGTIATLYELENDSLAWYEDGRLLPAAGTAVRLLLSAADHGLEPAEYDAELLDSLLRLQSGPGSTYVGAWTSG